jgi:hypothetical protein
MTRAIRTGTNYSCGGGGDCISGGSVFSFTDPQGRAIIYTFIPPTQNTNGYIEQSIDGDAFQLTDPTINVTQLSFYLTGSPDGSLDYEQPFVRMTVAGTAAAGPDAEFSFSIETAAAMRGIDI